VRAKGEDFQPCSLLASTGTRLQAQHLMAFAALGIGAVLVRRKPQISVLATGNEIQDVPPSQTSSPPGGTTIYNANSPYLVATMRAAGAEAHYGGLIPDTKAAFTATLEKLIEAPPGRIIVSTGAVSKGEFDFIPAALADLGAEILFHRVAIKPGRPVLFAMLPGGIPFFGLPGNPISAAVGFRFFMMPLLRAAWGLPPEPPLRLRLSEAYAAKPGLRLFLKAELTIRADGTAAATVLPGQESFLISPLLKLNGWIVRDEAAGPMEAGSLVDFYPADPFASMARAA
jgi:molybdopterin molybdotransferase